MSALAVLAASVRQLLKELEALLVRRGLSVDSRHSIFGQLRIGVEMLLAALPSPRLVRDCDGCPLCAEVSRREVWLCQHPERQGSRDVGDHIRVGGGGGAPTWCPLRSAQLTLAAAEPHACGRAPALHADQRRHYLPCALPSGHIGGCVWEARPDAPPIIWAPAPGPDAHACDGNPCSICFPRRRRRWSPFVQQQCVDACVDHVLGAAERRDVEAVQSAEPRRTALQIRATRLRHAAQRMHRWARSLFLVLLVSRCPPPAPQCEPEVAAADCGYTVDGQWSQGCCWVLR